MPAARYYKFPQLDHHNLKVGLRRQALVVVGGILTGAAVLEHRVEEESKGTAAPYRQRVRLAQLEEGVGTRPLVDGRLRPHAEAKRLSTAALVRPCARLEGRDRKGAKRCPACVAHQQHQRVRARRPREQGAQRHAVVCRAAGTLQVARAVTQRAARHDVQ